MNEDYVHLARSYISAAQGRLAFPEAKTFVAAVNEAENNVQAPASLIYMSALSAMSLAVQSVCDLKTPFGSVIPTSLMLLILGDSGERKSFVMNNFLKPFRHIQRRELLADKAGMDGFELELEIWTAKKKVLVNRIAKSMDEVERAELMEALKVLHSMKPLAPMSMQFVYEDATSQALFKGLSAGYPYAGLVTSEGKEILVGRAFNDLPKQNSLWSGDDVTIDRVNAGRFVVSGARLTVAIMVQGGLFDDYLKRRGQEARASGLWARFLVANPDSTQGTRFIENPLQSWKALEVFSKRIMEITEEGVANYKLGQERKVLNLSREATDEWVKFANFVEGQIRPGGYFERATDHASKLAENVARVAAVVSYFEYGDVTVSRDCLLDAIDFCMRCSIDFKELFVSSTREEREAETLWLWLNEKFDDGVTKIRISELMSSGPNATRKKARLELALDFLSVRKKIEIWKEEGVRYVGEAPTGRRRVRKRIGRN
ncbi:YfjI family protein [Pseudomonas aeruginosa]|uniref:YfjI family protein n=1 Tax=Pseudomonas aeruginosa TaxID=287 RepID=UPI0020327C5A|nr:YfjI family protein [Pseudomonas aeruginosa]MCM1999624.1 YfjI family protein [Pseudomonas aeruginosa]